MSTSSKPSRTARFLGLLTAGGGIVLAASLASPGLSVADAANSSANDKYGTELTLTNDTHKSTSGPSQIRVWDFKDGESQARVLWPGQSATWSGSDGDTAGPGRDVRLVVQQGDAKSGFAVTSWDCACTGKSNVYFYNDAGSRDAQSLSDFKDKESYTDINDKDVSITAQVTERTNEQAKVAMGFQSGFEQKGTWALPTKTNVEVKNQTKSVVKTLGTSIAPGESSNRTFNRPIRADLIATVSDDPADVGIPWALYMGMPSDRVGSLCLKRGGQSGENDLAPMTTAERRLVEQKDRFRSYTVDRLSDTQGTVRILITVHGS